MNKANHSMVAWALALLTGASQLAQGIESGVPVLFVCVAIICGAIERGEKP